MPDTMMLGKRIALALLLLCILFTFCVSGAGCSSVSETTTPAISYKTYEMKEDDIRLKALQHPLFSFEYPECFNLVDLNLDPVPSINRDISVVYFTGEQVGFHKQYLSIFIVTPEYLKLLNTNDMLEYYLSLYTPVAEDITRKEVFVSGISADYLKAVGTYLGQQKSLRVAIFDHAGLYWAIQLIWYYPNPEPPEVQGYFDHVIETFKILE
jgi:hypothetical protein